MYVDDRNIHKLLFYIKQGNIQMGVCSFSLENEKEQFEYDKIYLYM